MPGAKSKTVPYSTRLTEETRKLLEKFCKERGIRQNHFVEQAILEKLEDEMDCEIIASRELEELVPWKRTG